MALRHDGSDVGMVLLLHCLQFVFLAITESRFSTSSVPISLNGWWLRRNGLAHAIASRSLWLLHGRGLNELAWDNAGKRTGSSKHEKTHITQVPIKGGAGQSQRLEPR